ncbi:hypothetical protein GGTG_10473 [Gaeumannomyces tritici R3-111a-1]|uniref:HNH nuclease domain-containing protein n=1 Tax=Gaeumannomyces tritici (strain R3-111a-1) TaxID=644352 RepID=J3PAE7_GAET3|nr:hypothetical protein GGTG_10473 [Gaeumannomyces tritici R3-111a-1]EJT71213.1 hypothetical protein GGTG_10473 [Gaeumannomyces tritici R3-111a-1]
MQLRPAANEPESQAQRLRKADFLHPGYPGKAVLLSLPALDDGGIDFDTALAACGLVAGNRWSDGSFSLDRSAAVSVERPSDGVLREPEYFFQLPGPLDPPYPIVPRFSHWLFPHDNLPPLWQRWAADATAATRTGEVARRCVLSNYGDGLEMAHLLPASEDDWWYSNRMQRYSPMQLFSSSPINGPANLLTLRADLHRVFDERHFCLVPKVGDNSGGDADPLESPQLVLHVFNSTPSGQLPGLWHNRAAHPIPATVAVECLFARFAWTVLSPSVFDMFLPSALVPRRLLLWSRDKGEWETEEASPEMCRQLWMNSRSRSPRKRSAPRSTGAAEELLVGESLGLYDSGYSRTDASEDDVYYYDDELGTAERQEEEPRGRSRKRRLSSEAERDCDDFGQSSRRRKMLFS